MKDQDGSAKGRCLCGAIAYEIEGGPIDVWHCHCLSCRRHTGAPVATYAIFEAGQVTFTKGRRGIFNSSPGIRRGFCGTCGTPLTWEGDVQGQCIIQFHISTLEDPDAFAPSFHWHDKERIAWFDVADDLPRYTTSPEGNAPCRHGSVTSDM